MQTRKHKVEHILWTEAWAWRASTWTWTHAGTKKGHSVPACVYQCACFSAHHQSLPTSSTFGQSGDCQLHTVPHESEKIAQALQKPRNDAPVVCNLFTFNFFHYSTSLPLSQIPFTRDQQWDVRYVHVRCSSGYSSQMGNSAAKESASLSKWCLLQHRQTPGYRVSYLWQW